LNSGIILVSCSSRHARHVARESGQILADEMSEGAGKDEERREDGGSRRRFRVV
jgi:hypothetical protein